MFTDDSYQEMSRCHDEGHYERAKEIIDNELQANGLKSILEIDYTQSPERHEWYYRIADVMYHTMSDIDKAELEKGLMPKAKLHENVMQHYLVT